MNKKIGLTLIILLGNSLAGAVMPPSTILDQEAKKEQSNETVKVEIAQLKTSVAGVEKKQEQVEQTLERFRTEQYEIKEGIHRIEIRLESLNQQEK